MADLRETIARLRKLADTWSIRYADPDNRQVAVKCAAELLSALSAAMSIGDRK